MSDLDDEAILRALPATIGNVMDMTAEVDYMTDLDTQWLMIGAILVFFMQTGFAMLEVGSVSVKNTKNILIKNIFDAAIGAVCWWFLGFGFAMGSSGGGFIGTSGFFMTGSMFWATDDSAAADDDSPPTAGWQAYNYGLWLFQWAFAATGATIVSGAVAERVAFSGYIIYSIVLTSFIYPIVVHWGWNTSGWATAWTEDEDILLMGCGVIDFAGSGVVHMTGGVAALIAAKIVGPRKGRFVEGVCKDLPQQSAVLQTLGTLILWFGWYGFNGASTLYICGYSGVAAKTMCTTTLAAAFGAIVTVALGKKIDGIVDPGLANNGILAGLVGITAPCSTCEPYAAAFIGIIAAFVYFFMSKTLKKFQIDDVVDASPVHCFCGMWGVIAAGLFATEDNYNAAYYDTRETNCAGLFYGGGAQIGANIVFVIAIWVWVGATSLALFGGLHAAGMLRVDSDMEERGMDESKHGGMTYPEMELAVKKDGGASVTKVFVNESEVAPV